jgi:hypothetical protein
MLPKPAPASAPQPATGRGRTDQVATRPRANRSQEPYWPPFAGESRGSRGPACRSLLDASDSGQAVKPGVECQDPLDAVPLHGGQVQGVPG